MICFHVQSGQEEAAARWDKHRAAQEQQLAEARGQLETALQERSATQEALQVLQLEARQQVHCLSLFFSFCSSSSCTSFFFRLHPVCFLSVLLPAAHRVFTACFNLCLLLLLLLLQHNKCDLRTFAHCYTVRPHAPGRTGSS